MIHEPSVKKIESLPSLVQTIHKYGLLEHKGFSKSLGQNFLTDYNVIRRIVRFAGDLTDQVVLEVGSGPTGLTRAILEHNPKALHVVEMDPKCIVILEDLKLLFPNLHIHPGNALDFDIASIQTPMHIIANLPYNVGTELLIRWLKKSDIVSSMTLMFQKEVADRITASPHTKAYGRLSILAQYICTVSHCMSLAPHLFTPPPKVHSSVVHLSPKKDIDLTLIPYLEKITQAGFGNRRKMIRTSLKDFINEESLTECGIEPTLRAENLTVADFICLVKKTFLI